MELSPPGNRRVSINNPQETSGRVPTTSAGFPTQSSKISLKRSTYAYRPSMMSNRSSGGQSLLPSSILQKTSLNPPGSLQSKPSNVSSVHYADEEGKPLTDKNKDKDKGRGKGKGTGTRLLTMLRKTLQGSQSDEMAIANQTPNLIPFGDVVGCLAIHIKSCRQFSQRFLGQQCFNLFMRVSINNIVKCTKIRHLKAVNNEKNLVLRFGEMKYFSVQVPRRQDDERNFIYLELMHDGGDPETPPISLGGAESHLYEVIQKGCFTEVMHLMHKNSSVCRVEVEFMFSYGNFGYGFSHQLKPLQKAIEPSMFMNIAPPPERTDPVTNVITPQRVEYPAFLSPEFNVSIGVPEASQATVVQLEKLCEKPRERLERMKEEYKNMSTWIEKADYLRNLINPKMTKRDNKGSSIPSESNSSALEELERTTYDIHHRKSEAISNEYGGDKEGRVIPVLKVLDQNYSELSLPKISDSTPLEDVLLPPIHSLQIVEENEMPHLPKTSEPEDRPHEERKSIVFSSDEELMPKHPSILKISSSQQENRRKMEKSPHFSDVLIIPDKPFEDLNTNKKGRPPIELRKSWERHPTDVACSLRKVAFAQKDYTIPVCKAETTEFKPKHQFQKLSKSGLDPFLRNINSKMSFRKKKDHDDGYRNLSTSSAEILEHEDQDPPYPGHSGSAGSDATWAENPRPVTVQMVNRDSLPPDLITATIVISDRKNKLSLDSVFNSANSLNTKSIFASDNPVVSLTKLSDSDNKLITDSSFNTTKPSNRRLSKDSNSNTTKPSDRKLSSDPSSNTTKPSDTKLFSDPSSNKLSQGPSSNASQLSGSNRLSHNPSINGNKSSYTSDLNKVSRDPSIVSTRSSDPNKLSRDPSFVLAKSSDPNKLSRDPSFILAKSSDPNKLSYDPSIISTRSSDPNKLSHDPSIVPAKSSDPNKLSHDPSIISARSSDPNKLSRDPSFVSARSSDPKKLSHDPSIISARSSDPNKLSRDPSINSTKLSDPSKLSRDPSIFSTKSSDPNKLYRDPSIISGMSSDPKLSRDPSIISGMSSDPKLSRDPSIISAKSSDPNKLSHDPSIISGMSSNPNKLSHDPSIISMKLSDMSKLSRESSINASKSSDTNQLSYDPNIISAKSLDSNNSSASSSPTVNSDTTTNAAEPPGTKNMLDPVVSTIDSSDKQSKLEWLPNVQGASSVTENINTHRSSNSVNFTSDIEILKQSIVLKSILSKNLQDLSDELFSKSELYTNDEGYSPPPSVHSRPSDSTDDRVFGKVQDLNSWRSSKDLLNSQVLLSPVVKNSPQDLLPEGEPGKSSDIEDYDSEKLLEAAGRNFPMNRKSSFKKKHLVSEESSSEHVLSGSIYEYVIKQIFTAPIFSQLGIGIKSSSEAQMDSQDQLLTPWERSVTSHIINYEEKDSDVNLSQSKSIISQIIQSFPVNTLLESGIIKVIELDKEHQNSLLDSQTTSSTEQYSDSRSQIKLLSRQNTSSINPLDSSVSGAEYTEDCQSISTQESKYPVRDTKSDSPNDTEEMELDSNLESSSSSLDKVKDTDTAKLKNILKNIFSIFFKYNQSERRQQPEKDSESLIKHSSSSGTEHLEKIQENFNKADKKVDRKPILNPKLRMFLEKLSETEVKNLKCELSKHIQHYLVERLTESGHITKEDLPTIYHKLYLMNEKGELKEQTPFQEKYSETVKEIMSFVNNFNHHFIDKHLETKLRGFLSEILQNYFLKNLSVSNLFNETDAMALHASMSPVRSKSELGQDIADGNFGSSLKINMQYPVTKSLQHYLQDLSENELLSLKTDLSKYLQVLFIEKLYKSGLVSERQLKGISQEIISLHSPSIPLKHIKTNLPFRNESYFMREDSEEQMKYFKNGQNAALHVLLKDKCRETELSRKKERESSFSQILKENLPAIWEQKNIYTREEETLNLIQIQSFLNKNNQANPLTRSPERPSDVSLKKQKKDHGFMQFTQVEGSVYKTEIQDPYSWDSRSKTIQSKPCLEKTLKMKLLDKRENNNLYKLTAQEKLDTEFSSYLKLPNCKIPKEKEPISRLSFPTWKTNTFIHVKPEIGEQSKLDHYYQRLKGNNNNNKKHLVTFAQFKNEMETLYRNPYEACNEKRAKISESQSFKYKEKEKSSRPFFFPEVLKRENTKSKRKERDHATKPKKSFHKIVRLLPATLPTTRPHLRKSAPRNLLHWTARRTIHDCLDRFDDLHAPTVKCPKKSKSGARLLSKSPDDSHNQAKHCARPYTAPEPNKRRESAAWKFASPRMVSAGLLHLYATPAYGIRKVRSKRKLKEDIEKRPLISEIIQMLDNAE